MELQRELYFDAYCIREYGSTLYVGLACMKVSVTKIKLLLLPLWNKYVMDVQMIIKSAVYILLVQPKT